MELEPNMPAGHLASLFDAQGPNLNCLTACAASSQAIGEAAEIIRLGEADVMLSGGAHSMIHPFGVTGFNLLTALSTRNDNPRGASRPFDLHRDGFVLGEGAGMLILEELEHARRRGAHIYAELLGWASTCDAHHMCHPDPSGEQAARALHLALAKAGVRPQQVDYLNAHGTSTPAGDKAETLVVKKVFGDAAYNVPISSIKSQLGHMQGACGSSELAACCLAIRDNILPPTINYEYPDRECDLDYVPNQARHHHVDIAVSNSFSFGGRNTAVVLQRYRNGTTNGTHGNGHP
jgi:3-oxoacyl-[acyl-carrier-protein] synthase II